MSTRDRVGRPVAATCVGHGPTYSRIVDLAFRHLSMSSNKAGKVTKVRGTEAIIPMTIVRPRKFKEVPAGT